MSAINNPASLAAQFGGIPVAQSPSAPTSGNDLASQFGGTPTSATSNPNGSNAPSSDFTAQQLPSSGGISINPQSNGIFDVAQREIDKFRQAIKDRTGNSSGNNAVANLMTLPVDAPLRTLSGAIQSERSEGNRLQGSKEAVKGIVDTVGTLAPIEGVGSRAMEAVNAESALNIGKDILKNSSALAKKVISKYKDVPVPDPGVVQAPLRDSLRATANQLAQDHGVPLSPNTSLREALTNVGKGLQDKAKVVYNALDEATGGRFQRFDDALRDVSKQMRSAINDPDLTEELQAQRDVIQKASDEAFFRAAKEHGIDPAMADAANANYKQGAALKDVQRALNTHINEGRTELIPDAEAQFSIRAANNKLNRLYDSGRLQQAFGDRTPQTLDDFHQAFTQETQLKDAAKQAAAHNARAASKRHNALLLGAGAALGHNEIKKVIDLVK